MSLTLPRAPFGIDPAGRASPAPAASGTVHVEPHPRRIQAVVDGRVVLDTERALMVHRPGRSLACAFPAELVNGLANHPEPRFRPGALGLRSTPGSRKFDGWSTIHRTPTIGSTAVPRRVASG